MRVVDEFFIYISHLIKRININDSLRKERFCGLMLRHHRSNLAFEFIFVWVLYVLSVPVWVFL